MLITHEAKRGWLSFRPYSFSVVLKLNSNYQTNGRSESARERAPITKYAAPSPTWRTLSRRKFWVPYFNHRAYVTERRRDAILKRSKCTRCYPERSGGEWWLAPDWVTRVIENTISQYTLKTLHQINLTITSSEQKNIQFIEVQPSTSKFIRVNRR